MTQTAHGVAESIEGLCEKLKPEGSALAPLREELLTALACTYLRVPSLATPEVAHLLGLLDIQVFEQPFATWTGSIVRAYRDVHLAVGGVMGARRSGRKRQEWTTTMVAGPASLSERTPYQPSGMAGSVHRKNHRASSGDRLIHPPLFF